jgi:ABC-type uncharacterized transport system permease subunit
MTELLSGVSVVCFGASYFAAWLLELTRLVFRSGVRTAALAVFAVAGILAHTLHLGFRVATVETSSYDWYLVAAWVLAAIYLYLMCRQTQTPVGVFLLPLVLALVGAARLVTDDRPMSADATSMTWGMLHGVFFLAGTVAVLVGFASGLTYLVADFRLRRRLTPSGRFRLPSLEWLERTNARAIAIAVPALVAGFLAGAALNVHNHRRDVDFLPWRDPIVWSSSIPVVWIVAVALFNAWYRPARQGRKMAYLTVASFGLLALAVVLQISLPTEHSGRMRPGQNPPRQASPSQVPSPPARGAP